MATQNPYTWKREGMLTFHVANDCDNIRLKRQGKYKDKITFDDIYAFVDKLQSHKSSLDSMVVNPSISTYDLFHNPLIEAVMQFYNISIEDYRHSERRKVSDYAQDMSDGLNMIIDSFEDLDKSPKYFPETELNALRDFSLELSAQERRFEENPKLGLAA